MSRLVAVVVSHGADVVEHQLCVGVEIPVEGLEVSDLLPGVIAGRSSYTLEDRRDFRRRSLRDIRRLVRQVFHVVLHP